MTIDQQLLDKKASLAFIPKSERESLEEAAASGCVEVVVKIVSAQTSPYRTARMLLDKFSSIEEEIANVNSEYLYARLASQKASQAEVMGRWHYRDGFAGESLLKSIKDQLESNTIHGAFRQVITLEKQGEIEGALDVLFLKIDELFVAGEFTQVDAFIRNLECSKVSVDLLLGVLTATLVADDQLPSRLGFYKRVEDSFKTRGENIDALLFGLKELAE